MARHCLISYLPLSNKKAIRTKWGSISFTFLWSLFFFFSSFLPNASAKEEPPSLLLQQEIIQEILELISLEKLLITPHQLPTTVTLLRDLIPYTPPPTTGQANLITQGTQVHVHEVTQAGILIPIQLHPEIHTLPKKDSGRLSPQAIIQMSQGLSPGYGLISFDATDFLFQIRSRLTQPSEVALTEYARTQLTQKGEVIANGFEFELRKGRLLRFKSVSEQYIHLVLDYSETTIPRAWTDYDLRKKRLDELLAQLTPCPIDPHTQSLTPPPQLSSTPSSSSQPEMGLLPSQVMQLTLLAEEQKIKQKYYRAQQEHQLASIRKKLQSFSPPISPETPSSKATPFKWSEAMNNLVQIYYNMVETHLQKGDFFQATTLLQTAQQELSQQALLHQKNPSPWIQKLAPLTEKLKHHQTHYQIRKQELLAVAQSAPPLLDSNLQAFFRDYPRLPFEEFNLLEQKLAAIHPAEHASAASSFPQKIQLSNLAPPPTFNLSKKTIFTILLASTIALLTLLLLGAIWWLRCHPSSIKDSNP